jgi:WD40 repeat protein
MRFSRSGKYLATAGQDCVVVVWEVVPNRGKLSNTSGGDEKERTTKVESPRTSQNYQAGQSDLHVYGVPVLQSTPYRVYRGHKQDVLDVAWSKTNFLLSASMDKTVRLWHASMNDCLRVFK